MKKLFFVIFLLAVASLGSTSPELPTTPLITPISPISPVRRDPPQTPLTSPPVDFGRAFSQISPQCLANLFNIVKSPAFAECVPLSDFTSIAPVFLNLSSSLSDPFNKLLPQFEQFSGQFCTAPKCDDNGVKQTISVIQTACKTELDNKNIVIEAILGLAIFYSPARDAVCLKDDQGKFCLIEALVTIFSLPPSTIKLVNDNTIDSIIFSNPKNICTQCIKNILTIFFDYLTNNDIAMEFLGFIGFSPEMIFAIKDAIDVKCSVSFLPINPNDPKDVDISKILGSFKMN